MKNFLSIAILAMLAFFTSCGSSTTTTGNGDGGDGQEIEQEGSKPITLSYSQTFDTAKDNRFVIIEGYLQLPGMMYTSGESAQVDFHARPFQRFGRDIIANIKTGSCNNCMTKLGEKYQLSDLKIKGDDGTDILANQRVRLTGGLRVHLSSLSEDGISASLDVSKIEKIPEIEVDYKQLEVVTITKENLFDSTLKYKLSMAEGKLEIPSMLFMENDVTLDLMVAGKRIGVNFNFGTGPNQIEPIPANYAKADFKIYDFKGELINLNKAAKVWGNRSTPTKDLAGVLYVEHIEQ